MSRFIPNLKLYKNPPMLPSEELKLFWGDQGPAGKKFNLLKRYWYYLSPRLKKEFEPLKEIIKHQGLELLKEMLETTPLFKPLTPDQEWKGGQLILPFKIKNDSK